MTDLQRKDSKPLLECFQQQQQRLCTSLLTSLGSSPFHELFQYQGDWTNIVQLTARRSFSNSNTLPACALHLWIQYLFLVREMLKCSNTWSMRLCRLCSKDHFLLPNCFSDSIRHHVLKISYIHVVIQKCIIFLLQKLFLKGLTFKGLHTKNTLWTIYWGAFEKLSLPLTMMSEVKNWKDYSRGWTARSNKTLTDNETHAVLLSFYLSALYLSFKCYCRGTWLSTNIVLWGL